MKKKTEICWPPEGFTEFNSQDNFLIRNGPIYLKTIAPDADELEYLMYFLPSEKHANGMNTCHGGMIATLCDLTLGIAASQATDNSFVATASLHTDYIAAAPIGKPILTRTSVTKVTRSLVFARSTCESEGSIVATASGVMKRIKPVSTGIN